MAKLKPLALKATIGLQAGKIKTNKEKVSENKKDILALQNTIKEYEAKITKELKEIELLTAQNAQLIEYRDDLIDVYERNFGEYKKD